jgi:hypothetical protein
MRLALFEAGPYRNDSRYRFFSGQRKIFGDLLGGHIVISLAKRYSKTK